MPSAAWSRIRIFVACGAILTLLVLAFVQELQLFLAEHREHHVSVTQDAVATSPYVELEITPLAFDPVKRELTLRVQGQPNGTLARQDSLTRNLTLDFNTPQSFTEKVFKRGQPMEAVDVAITLTHGDAAMYPYDRHDGILRMVLATAPPLELEGIPMVLHANLNLSGYDLVLEETARSRATTGSVFLNLSITRSRSVVLFASFVILLMWAVSLAAVGVVFHVVLSGNRPDLPLLPWLATVLFALLPLRNAVPSSPPLGSLCDYIAFFWAEALVTASMIILVFLWIARRPPACTPQVEAREAAPEGEEPRPPMASTEGA